MTETKTETPILQKIDELASKLHEAKLDPSKSPKEIAALEAELKQYEDLQKRVSNLLDGYVKAHPNFVAKRAQLTKWVDDELKKDSRYVGWRQRFFDKNAATIADFARTLKGLKTARDAAQARKETSAKRAVEKSNEQKRADARLTLWLELVKSIQSELDALEDTKTTVVTEHAAGEGSLVVFTTEQSDSVVSADEDPVRTSFDGLLATLGRHLVDPKQVDEEVLRVFEAALKARKAKDDADAEAKAAAAAATEAQKGLDAFVADRNTALERHIRFQAPSA